MNVGDHITLNHLAESMKCVVLEVEKYRGTLILRYRFLRNNKEAIGVCFPELPYLPTVITDRSLYAYTAWLDWEEHRWPVPVGLPSGGASRLILEDPRIHARRKVDHVLELVRASNMHEDLEIRPETDSEHEQWRRWWPHF